MLKYKRIIVQVKQKPLYKNSANRVEDMRKSFSNNFYFYFYFNNGNF